MKPNTYLGYYTHGTNSLLRPNEYNQTLLSIAYGGYYGNGPTNAVTSAHDLIPFVARPRTKAVGAQSGVGGAFSAADEVNLRTRFGFTGELRDHSGQFQRNIQEPMIWPFYSQLLESLFSP